MIIYGVFNILIIITKKYFLKSVSRGLQTKFRKFDPKFPWILPPGGGGGGGGTPTYCSLGVGVGVLLGS